MRSALAWIKDSMEAMMDRWESDSSKTFSSREGIIGPSAEKENIRKSAPPWPVTMNLWSSRGLWNMMEP